MFLENGLGLWESAIKHADSVVATRWRPEGRLGCGSRSTVSARAGQPGLFAKFPLDALKIRSSRFVRQIGMARDTLTAQSIGMAPKPQAADLLRRCRNARRAGIPTRAHHCDEELQGYYFQPTGPLPSNSQSCLVPAPPNYIIAAGNFRVLRFRRVSRPDQLFAAQGQRTIMRH